MAIDASIPLQVKTQQSEYSPIQTIGQLMNIRNSGAEFALRQAQALDAKAQADQRAADLRDQGIITSALQDPEKAKRIGAGDYSDIEGVTQPKTVDVLRKARDEHVTKQLANSKEQNALYQEHTAQVAKGLNSLDEYMKASDANEAKLPEMYSQWLNTTKNEGLLDFMAPGVELPSTLNDPTKLRQIIATLGMHHEALTQALGIQKEREGIANTESEVAARDAKAGQEAEAFATEQPVKAAIAGATLADDDLLTPEQRSQAGLTEAARTETARHNLAEENKAKSAETGTWSIQEDSEGKPIEFNSKTGATRAVSGLQKSGTQAKKDAALEKQIGPARDAVNYADAYQQSGNFTGPGDEALMEKFFEVAKPSTGFRMTQPQMDMLMHSRDAVQGLIARAKHTLTPNAPYFDDEQRRNIVSTMKILHDVKMKGLKGETSEETPSLPASARAQLKEGTDTTFGNGQVWTLHGGQPQRVK